MGAAGGEVVEVKCAEAVLADRWAAGGIHMVHVRVGRKGGGQASGARRSHGRRQGGLVLRGAL